jgi:SRR1
MNRCAVTRPDSDGWTVVSTKRPVGPTPSLIAKLKANSSRIVSDSSESIVKLVLKESAGYSFPSYFRDLNFNFLVVLGVGSFGSSWISKAQLCLANGIRLFFKSQHAVCYDPVLTLPEKQALEQLRFCFSPDFKLATESIALLFMPHCDKSLYLDVLKKHRHRLNQISIIGNDFRIYALRSSGDEGQFWASISKCVYVRGFPVTPALSAEVLSDTVFTSFPAEHLPTLVSLLS